MASENQQLSLEAGQLKFELKLLKDRFLRNRLLFLGPVVRVTDSRGAAGL